MVRQDTVDEKELIEGAIRGLYEEVGLPMPEAVKAAIRGTQTQIDRIAVLNDVRAALGNHPRLAGTQSLFAAINGFKHATDPICGLVSPRVNSNTFASIDQDFGVGIELEGVVGTRGRSIRSSTGIATGVIHAERVVRHAAASRKTSQRRPCFPGG